MRSHAITCFRFAYVLDCTSLFSINSYVLKLNKSQKPYSVNKELVLGVFSRGFMHAWACTEMRSIMLCINYAEIFYNLRYSLDIKTDTRVDCSVRCNSLPSFMNDE